MYDPDWYRANSYYLTAAITSVHQALQALVEHQSDRFDAQEIVPTLNPPPILEQLCTIFNLSAFDRQILLLCVAQAIIPQFPALCAQAQGQPPRFYPTLSLALQLSYHKDWQSLTPQAPLRHWQLIEVGNAEVLTLCPLQIDECILHYLLGEPYQDPALRKIVQVVELQPSLILPASQQAIASQLATLLSSSNTLIQLCSSDIAERRLIASTACTQLGLVLKRLSLSHLPSQADALKHLCDRTQREAILTRSVLLIEGDSLPFNDPTQPSKLLDLLEFAQFPLIISTSERVYSPHRLLITFEVPKLTKSEQLALWQFHLNATIEVEAIAAQFNLNAREIEATCHQFSTSQGDPYLLWDYCRVQARPRLDDLAQRLEVIGTWDDLIIPEQQRQLLWDITIQVRQQAKVYQQWGFARQGSRGLGISVLFYGESGTGKTMAAEVLAGECRLDLYRIDLSTVISKYIGETEKNLRRIFDAAETGGVILLFDEADALFGKRTEIKDSHDRYANIEISYLLQRMEAYQGLAILTTNLKNALDRAFERRLRFIVEFPLPNAAARTQIWQRIFPTQTPTQSLNFQKLGQLNITGGNIRTIAINAAFLAADADEPVMMKHILQATQREYLKLKRLLTDEEIKDW